MPATGLEPGESAKTLSQSTGRKLSLLQLAQELGNVSKACRLMGYHRDTFYEAPLTGRRTAT
jgi:hypothetical protein